jgi:hypothetical protein
MKTSVYENIVFVKTFFPKNFLWQTMFLQKFPFFAQTFFCSEKFVFVDTVKASNFGPHGNFGTFFASSFSFFG